MKFATWRDYKAREKNLARPRILKDEAVYEIATKRPTDVDAFTKLKFVQKNFSKSRGGKEIIEIVHKLVNLPVAELPELPQLPSPPKDVFQSYRFVENTT